MSVRFWGALFVCLSFLVFGGCRFYELVPTLARPDASDADTSVLDASADQSIVSDGAPSDEVLLVSDTMPVEDAPRSDVAGVDSGTADGSVHDAPDSGVSCSMGETRCGPFCTRLESDPMNCGRCGNACGSGLGCAGGACRRQTVLTAMRTGRFYRSAHDASCESVRMAPESESMYTGDPTRLVSYLRSTNSGVNDCYCSRVGMIFDSSSLSGTIRSATLVLPILRITGMAECYRLVEWSPSNPRDAFVPASYSIPLWAMPTALSSPICPTSTTGSAFSVTLNAAGLAVLNRQAGEGYIRIGVVTATDADNVTPAPLPMGLGRGLYLGPSMAGTPETTRLELVY